MSGSHGRRWISNNLCRCDGGTSGGFRSKLAVNVPRALVREERALQQQRHLPGNVQLRNRQWVIHRTSIVPKLGEAGSRGVQNPRAQADKRGEE